MVSSILDTSKEGAHISIPLKEVHYSEMIKIRKVIPADLDSIQLIEQYSFLSPYSAHLIRYLMKITSDFFLVAVSDESSLSKEWGSNIVGFSIAQMYEIEELDNRKINWLFKFASVNGIEPNTKIGHVIDIAVHPQYRRQGIGSTLLKELMRRLIENGCTQIRLEVRASNLAAQKMYDKFGFQSVEIIPGFYENKEDAIVLVFIVEETP